MRSRRRAGEQFRAFLAGRARSAEALYILGDLFESWIGDDDEDPYRDGDLRGARAAHRKRRALLRHAWQSRLSARPAASSSAAARV